LQRPLRLPKEHETGKQVIYIIVRYDHIYPCRNSDLSRNEADINWTIGADNEVAEPIRGRGLDPNAVAPYFSGLSGNDVYVAFWFLKIHFQLSSVPNNRQLPAGFHTVGSHSAMRTVPFHSERPDIQLNRNKK
jgi:hypothetical protein